MRKSIVLIASVFYFISCESDHEKLIAKVKPIVKDYVLSTFKPDSIKVDTFRILKIDTLTPKQDSANTFWELSALSDVVEDEIDMTHDEVNNNMDRARLYGSIGSEFFKSEQRKVKEKLSEFNSLRLIHISIVDRMGMLNKYDSLGQIDSITKTGYKVYFKLSGADAANQELNIDTGQVKLNNNFRVIDLRNQVSKPYIDQIKKILKK